MATQVRITPEAVYIAPSGNLCRVISRGDPMLQAFAVFQYVRPSADLLGMSYRERLGADQFTLSFENYRLLRPVVASGVK